jgi:general stress protein 26
MERSMRDELKQLYDMIDEIEIGMMTTGRGDGHLESRAMAARSTRRVPTCGS